MTTPVARLVLALTLGSCLLQAVSAQIPLNISCRYKGVYHVERNGRYNLTRTAAEELCHNLNSSLPTMEQMQIALAAGFETCRYGWIKTEIVVPRIHANPICAASNTGVYILESNITEKYDTYCFNASETRVKVCDPILLPESYRLYVPVDMDPGPQDSESPDGGKTTPGPQDGENGSEDGNSPETHHLEDDSHDVTEAPHPGDDYGSETFTGTSHPGESPHGADKQSSTVTNFPNSADFPNIVGVTESDDSDRSNYLDTTEESPEDKHATPTDPMPGPHDDHEVVGEHDSTADPHKDHDVVGGHDSTADPHKDHDVVGDHESTADPHKVHDVVGDHDSTADPHKVHDEHGDPFEEYTDDLSPEPTKGHNIIYPGEDPEGPELAVTHSNEAQPGGEDSRAVTSGGSRPKGRAKGPSQEGASAELEGDGASKGGPRARRQPKIPDWLIIVVALVCLALILAVCIAINSRATWRQKQKLVLNGNGGAMEEGQVGEMNGNPNKSQEMVNLVSNEEPCNAGDPQDALVPSEDTKNQHKGDMNIGA